MTEVREEKEHFQSRSLSGKKSPRSLCKMFQMASSHWLHFCHLVDMIYELIDYVICERLLRRFCFDWPAEVVKVNSGLLDSFRYSFYLRPTIKMDTMISNYTNLVPNLERQELESSVQGSTSPQVYGQLLAIYLLINDL